MTYSANDLMGMPIGSVVYDNYGDKWTCTRQDWWLWRSEVDTSTMMRDSCDMDQSFGPMSAERTDLAGKSPEPEQPVDIGEFELTLTVRAVRQIKAEAFDAGVEAARDLAIIEGYRVLKNPYREGKV